ncbi:MAG: acyl carrier protein [Lachnospiraceae bacterium]|nr:acyl carrier protein [Lachnospiraceae bacterium]
MIEKIEEIIREYKDDDSIVVTEETNLNTDLGLSSMDYLSLIVEIEDLFGVKIKDEELSKFRTIGDITKLIAELL